jgi:lipopolysaccharide exporter
MSSTETIAAAGREQLWGHVLKLATGAVAAQLVIVVTTPLVTRCYSPHAFGVGSFYVSVLTILGPAATLNYHQAVLLPRRDEDAIRVAQLSLWAALAIGCLLVVATYGFRGVLRNPFNVPELAPYTWVFPAGVLLRSGQLVITSWLSRHGEFGVQGRARFGQALIERGLTLVAGFGGATSAVVLVFSRIVSVAGETAMLVFGARTTLQGSLRLSTPSELRASAAEYRDFPRYSTGAMLLATGGSQLPILLLPVLFSPEVAGLFALGYRLLQLPMQLLGESIRNVYYKQLAENIGGGQEMRSGFTTLRRHLVAVGMFPFALLLVSGEVIFAALFGPEWGRAGVFAGIVGVLVLFQLVGAPLSAVLTAYRRQRALAVVSAAIFVVNACALLVGYAFGSVELGLTIMTSSGVLVYLYMNYVAEKILGIKHSEQFVTYSRILCLNVPFVCGFWVIASFWRTPEVLMSAAAALAACYYGTVFRGKIATKFGDRTSSAKP